jgi:hypothetical protein
LVRQLRRAADWGSRPGTGQGDHRIRWPASIPAAGTLPLTSLIPVDAGWCTALFDGGERSWTC